MTSFPLLTSLASILTPLIAKTEVLSQMMNSYVGLERSR